MIEITVQQEMGIRQNVLAALYLFIEQTDTPMPFVDGECLNGGRYEVMMRFESQEVAAKFKELYLPHQDEPASFLSHQMKGSQVKMPA